MTTIADDSGVLLARARVRRTERISPSFQRVTLDSPAFVELGDDGYDTRIKLLFPGPTGRLLEATGADWYSAWLAMPEYERPPVRTYTVRDVQQEGEDTLLVVDFVVHEPVSGAGPACRWALAAAVGDEVQVVGPRRGGPAYGGTEFAPGDLRDLLLVGDETAVPAIARILADLPPGFRGRAFLEVPNVADVQRLDVPRAFTVSWVPRAAGGSVVAEVRRWLELPGSAPGPDPRPVIPTAGGAEIDLWETPTFSSSGEDLVAPGWSGGAAHLGGTYAWVAGESGLVRTLRRALVTELGMDRERVAFMGYWRRGVAMRS